MLAAVTPQPDRWQDGLMAPREMTNVTASLSFTPESGEKEVSFEFGPDREAALRRARAWVESRVKENLENPTLKEIELLASLTEDGPDGPADSTEDYVWRREGPEWR